MKKFGKVLLVAIMVVMLTAGCTMKCDMGMYINADKNVGMKIIMAYDKEMVDSMLSMGNMSTTTVPAEETTSTETTTAAEITDEQRWAFVEQSLSLSEEDGETIEKYTEEGYYGYSYTKEFGKLDEVTGETAETKAYINDDNFDEGQVLFIKEGNVYKSNMAIDKTEESFSQMSTYSTMGAMFDLTFSVTLPVKPISHNADKVSEDGKTLYWDLTKVENVEFEFDLTSEEAPVASTPAENKSVANKENQMNMMVYIGVAGLCVVVLVIVVIVIRKNSKKDNNATEVITDPTSMPTTSTPVTPITPVEPVVPVTPVESTEQTVPVEPVVPQEPVASEVSVEPTVPVTPVEPVVPVTPVQPTEPVVPVEPVTPVAPVMPEAPQMNTTPTEPVVPTTQVEEQNNNSNFNM